MNTERDPEDLFWQRVLIAAEAIDASDHSLDTLLSLLTALEEGFHDRFDPADKFEAYVTVSLCRSIRRHLHG